jgi:hypothetical protein
VLLEFVIIFQIVAMNSFLFARTEDIYRRPFTIPSDNTD